MSNAYRCEICYVIPIWRLDRHGDAVASWACDFHLSAVCHGMQRDWEDRTEITVYKAEVPR